MRYIRPNAWYGHGSCKRAYFDYICVILVGGLSLIQGRPLNTSVDISTQQTLPTKLLSVIQALTERQDSNILDFVLVTNAGLGLNLYEGDIKGFNPRHRATIRDPNALWATRVVPYIIDASIDPNVRTIIQEAIAEYHAKTCIRWVPRTNERDYVVFKKLTGCYSMVGKSFGGPQELSLMGPCARKGTAMHEMLHVLGFFHEQSRPDRDQWVEILLQNVKAGKERNFDRLPVDMVDTLGVQYDYESIMHYSRRAFSANGQPTILPKKDPFANLGQREGFSPRDIEKINKLYRCDLAYPTTHAPGNSNTQSSHPTGSTGTTPPVVTRPPIGWTAWSAWSVCNMQCSHFRYRYCLNPDRTFCPGDNQEFATCPSPCQVAVSLGCWANEPSSLAVPSVEGLYAGVNDSYRFRVAAVRRCADVATSLGHLVFAIADGGQCLTGPEAQRTFNTYGPSSECPRAGKGTATAINVYSFSKDMDGGWGAWTDWGQCSRSCGRGIKYRYRTCDSPPPIGNGRSCQGHDQETTDCNTESCQVASHCGTKYHTGRVGSSGYVQLHNYDNFMTCDYVIEAGRGDVTISLSVLRMEIEESMGCIYDALTIYDGANGTQGQVIGSFCGHSSLPHVQSSGPALFLRFTSDSTTTGFGFTLQFVINSKTRKACAQPFKPYNGNFTGSNFAGDTVIFSCNPGNHLVGQSNVRCVDQPGMAVWSDDFPVCMPGRRKRDAGFLEATSMNCTFENSLCSFLHGAQSKWRWMVVKGNDQSPTFQIQRARVDRKGTSEGNFLYIESTPLWHSFDTARVSTGRYVTDHVTPSCLRFWYRFYGNELVYLHVLQMEKEGERMAWAREGTPMGEWEEAVVDLHPQPFMQVTFEAYLGQKMASSAAIDDVTISPGKC